MSPQARGNRGTMIGVGAGLMLIALLVLQSYIGSGLFSVRTVTWPSAEDYGDVATAYANHLSMFGSRNVSGLVGEYESNATVEWRGNAAGLQGSYTGPDEIERLLNYFPGNLVNMTLSNEDQPIVGVHGSHLVVGSTFDWSGYSLRYGFINGLVAAQDSYAQVGGTWLISAENWMYISYNEQFPVST